MDEAKQSSKGSGTRKSDWKSQENQPRTSKTNRSLQLLTQRRDHGFALEDIFEIVVISEGQLLGYFSVKDLITVSGVNKKLYNFTIEKKLIKTLVRFGNLDEITRRKFWEKLSPREELEQEFYQNLNIPPLPERSLY